MNKPLMEVYLTQGEGEQEVYIQVIVSEKLANKMGDLRKANPQRWKNRDFDLLKQAKKELGLCSDLHSKQESPLHKAFPEVFKQMEPTLTPEEKETMKIAFQRQEELKQK